MSTLIFSFAAGRYFHDHLLAEAARLALDVDPTPRMIQFIVDHDGTPIEITGDEPLSESAPPQEAEE